MQVSSLPSGHWPPDLVSSSCSKLSNRQRSEPPLPLPPCFTVLLQPHFPIEDHSLCLHSMFAFYIYTSNELTHSHYSPIIHVKSEKMLYLQTNKQKMCSWSYWLQSKSFNFIEVKCATYFHLYHHCMDPPYFYWCFWPVDGDQSWEKIAYLQILPSFGRPLGGTPGRLWPLPQISLSTITSISQAILSRTGR